ncbi:MAG: CoA-binding protein [Deltaproteobacteria bacterium]|nr:MAG: CoA-binding protein [Deltaproteobacteria bacterium]
MERDEELRDLLERVHTIAVVGIKEGAADDAYRVPAYLQRCGYRILPVNPKLRRVLGEAVRPDLTALPGPVDLVNLFRAPAHVPRHVDEILALDPRPRAVWMQLGVRHDAAAARLRDAGIAVVQDRCLMVEHARLLGTRAGPATRAPRLRVPVHYDFASSLCYVAHRVMQRLAPELEALGIELVWSPVDVAHRIGPIRGAGIAPAVRANAARVAAELGVDLRMPAHWIDSRPALCGALLSERAERGASFREAAWRAVYEHGRELATADAVRELAAELGIAIQASELEAAQGELAARTNAASGALTSGVPTFVLGDWPCGGIQTEDTMRQLFRRFAETTRGRLAS